MENRKRTTTQCPNCGGSMTFEYTGDLSDKRIVCKFCGTAYDVPDTFKRVTTKRTRKGLLRGTETVEEVTEVRSDYPVAEQTPPQVVQISLSQPITGALADSQIQSRSVSVTSCIVVLALTCVLPAVIIFFAAGAGIRDFLTNDLGIDVGGVKNVSISRTLRSLDSSFLSYIAYSPDGRFLVAGSFSHLVIWNTETGLISAEFDLTSSVEHVFFTPDSQQIIVMNMGSIMFCDTATGQVERTINGNYASIAASSMYIAAATFQDSVELLSLESGEVVRTLDNNVFYVQQLVFSPDGRYLAAGGNKNNLAVWDIQTGRELFKGKATVLSVDKMAFSPNNQTLILGDSAELIFYEVLDSGFRYVNTKKITDDIFSVESLSFSPDGKELAIGNFFGEPLVWNMDDARVGYKLQTEDSVRPVAFSPDGTLVAGAGLQEEVYEWTLPDRASPTETSPTETN